MGRVVVAHRLDVDRDDLALAEQVADRGEERGAPTAVRARLDDELRPRLDHDLLVDPEVERVLERLRAEPRRLRPGVRLVEDVVRPRDRGPIEPPVDAEARAPDAPSQVVLHGGGILGGRVAGRAPRGSGPRPTRATGSRSRPDAASISDDEPIDARRRRSLVLAERDPALTDELRMPAAVAVRGRQAARERLEQRVRARVVPARSDVDVLRPEQVGERARLERPDDADPLERAPAAALRT